MAKYSIEEVINFLLRSAELQVDAFFTGKSDSIILPLEDYFKVYAPEGEYLELLGSFIEPTRLLFHNVYGISMNLLNKREYTYTLMYYSCLFSGICYCIDTENGERSKWLLNIEILYQLLGQGYLVAKDNHEVIGHRIGNIMSRIENGNMFRNAFSSQLNVIQAIKLEDRSTATKRLYMPIIPRDPLQTSRVCIFPEILYKRIHYSIRKYTDNYGVIIQQDNGRVTLSCSNPDFLARVYGKEKAMTILNLSKMDFVLPDVCESKFESCVHHYYPETISKVTCYNLDVLEMRLSGMPIYTSSDTARNIDFSLINVDTRGAKNFLKEKVGYDSLQADKQEVINSYTNANAYRYLRSKGVMYKSNYEKFGSNTQNIPIPSTIDEMKKLLASGIFEIDILRGGSRFKMYCTNSFAKLEEIYGIDFRVKTLILPRRIKQLMGYIKYCIKNNINVVEQFNSGAFQERWGILIAEGQNSERFTITNVNVIFSKVSSMQELLQNVSDCYSAFHVQEHINPQDLILVNRVDANVKDNEITDILQSFYLNNVIRVTKLY